MNDNTPGRKLTAEELKFDLEKLSIKSYSDIDNVEFYKNDLVKYILNKVGEYAEQEKKEQPELREPDGWVLGSSFQKKIEDILIGDFEYATPVYFSPPPVREVGDEEIEEIAEETFGENSSQRYYETFIKGMKEMRKLLTGK